MQLNGLRANYMSSHINSKLPGSVKFAFWASTNVFICTKIWCFRQFLHFQRHVLLIFFKQLKEYPISCRFQLCVKKFLHLDLLIQNILLYQKIVGQFSQWQIHVLWNCNYRPSIRMMKNSVFLWNYGKHWVLLTKL